MGSQIAAHIANVGIPCDLLDIPPTELTAEERTNGLTLDSPRCTESDCTIGAGSDAKRENSIAVLRPRRCGVDSGWQLSRSRRMVGGCGLDYRGGGREP